MDRRGSGLWSYMLYVCFSGTKHDFIVQRKSRKYSGKTIPLLKSYIQHFWSTKCCIQKNDSEETYILIHRDGRSTHLFPLLSKSRSEVRSPEFEMLLKSTLTDLLATRGQQKQNAETKLTYLLTHTVGWYKNDEKNIVQTHSVKNRILVTLLYYCGT